MYTPEMYERDTITINGYDFLPTEYRDYGTANTKTYVESPERALAGNIPDIETKITFRTARLRFNLDVMSLNVWRRLQIATDPNQFLVRYYDWQYDKKVDHLMYFATQDDIDIFNEFPLKQEYYIITKKTVDIVSTNNKNENIITITYHPNGGIFSSVNSNVFQFEPNENMRYLSGYQFSKYGADLIGWNTRSDGSGINYALGALGQATTSLILYARWSN